MRTAIVLLILGLAACGEAVEQEPVGESGSTTATTPAETTDDQPVGNSSTGNNSANNSADDPVGRNNSRDRPTTTPDDETPTTSACDGTGANPGTDDWSLEHDGMDREFRVHIPRNYDGMTPTPIVLNFHGRSMTGEQQALLSGMDATSDSEGFIAVYPEGTGSFEQTFNGGWCCGSAQTNNVDDVGFTEAILDKLESELCVDSSRVYAIGMSNGGFMSHRLGCELADRITAIGGVAGTLGMFDCSPARPVPVIHFHGTDDTVVPYNGFAGQVSAPGSIDTWRDVNGCSGSGEVYFEDGDVECEKWSNCDQGAEVRLCTVDGGGHTWPGGTSSFFGALGKTTDNISASEHSWEFFSQFSM